MKHLIRAVLLTTALGVLAARPTSGESAGGGTACHDGTVVTTVTLDYDDRILGDLTGLFLEVGYAEGASLPGTGTEASVRARVTSLIAPKFRVLAVDEDVEGREQRVRILVTTSDRSAVPAGPIARLTFDCADSKPLAASSFNCRTDQVADNSAQLLAPALARTVTCATAFGNTPSPSRPR